MKTNSVHEADSIAAKFEKIKDGMSEEALLRLMGAPQDKQADTWSYFENLAPLPGEQLRIYRILLANHEVAGKRIVSGPAATSLLLAAKFEKIKDGMSEKALLRLMGAPQDKQADTWSYFENRAPLPGEQLMIYQIVLRDHKVASKRIVPGPDATGPGQ